MADENKPLSIAERIAKMKEGNKGANDPPPVPARPLPASPKPDAPKSMSEKMAMFNKSTGSAAPAPASSRPLPSAPLGSRALPSTPATNTTTNSSTSSSIPGRSASPVKKWPTVQAITEDEEEVAVPFASRMNFNAGSSMSAPSTVGRSKSPVANRRASARIGDLAGMMNIEAVGRPMSMRPGGAIGIPTGGGMMSGGARSGPSSIATPFATGQPVIRAHGSGEEGGVMQHTAAMDKVAAGPKKRGKGPAKKAFMGDSELPAIVEIGKDENGRPVSLGKKDAFTINKRELNAIGELLKNELGVDLNKEQFDDPDKAKDNGEAPKADGKSDEAKGETDTKVEDKKAGLEADMKPASAPIPAPAPAPAPASTSTSTTPGLSKTSSFSSPAASRKLPAWPPKPKD